MIKKILTCFCIAGIILSGSVAAEYVSDRLYLGLYALPDSSTAPITTLNSGDSVEVLQSQGDFVQIKLSDGTQGWARAEFISKDLPAKLQLQQVTADRDNLRQQLRRMGTEQEQLKKLQKQLVSANRTIKKLNAQIESINANSSDAALVGQAQQTQIEDLQQRLREAEQQAASLAQEREALQNAQDQSSQDNNRRALNKIGLMLFFMVISLAMGVFIGIRWLGGRVRQRFNGIKVW